MAIRQHQVSFSAFASSASSATATQSPESQVPKQSKQGSTSQSFQQPSLALHVADGSAACTPPVSAVHPAASVVAHGVDGGECIHLNLRRVHVERPSWVCIRRDFWFGGIDPGWAGMGLDAPSFVPRGSAVVLGVPDGLPFIDGAVSRPGWYA